MNPVTAQPCKAAYTNYFCTFYRNEILSIPPKDVILPSLTLVKVKSGYSPSNYAGCSHFPFGNDLCYFFISSVLVLFMMLRMADLEINS